MIPVEKFENSFGPQWFEILKPVLEKQKFQDTMSAYLQLAKTEEVNPSPSFLFNAYKQCDFNKVKVVLIAEQPIKDSNGLAYSTLSMTRPPVLNALFEECYHNYVKEECSQRFIELDECYPHNNLTRWANQGVFLMHTHLSNNPTIGWESFSTASIKAISKLSKKPVVFILIGETLQQYEKIIESRHFVLKVPSWDSVSFKGNCAFLEANYLIKDNNLGHTISWVLSADVIDKYRIQVLVKDKPRFEYLFPVYYRDVFNYIFGSEKGIHFLHSLDVTVFNAYLIKAIKVLGEKPPNKAVVWKPNMEFTGWHLRKIYNQTKNIPNGEVQVDTVDHYYPPLNPLVYL